MSNNCLFCGGTGKFRYRMGEYLVFQCASCGTGYVDPMPDDEVLKKLYDGFFPRLDESLGPMVVGLASEFFRRLGLAPGQGLTMLDIGGGGGYYARAFEQLGYGEASYVDLDPKSCAFARSKMGLTRVFNDDAMKMAERGSTFDFILSRHLIEHLVDPVGFMRSTMTMLNRGGVFVAQFPNGDSLEYLPYTHLNIRDRINKISASNGFSRARVLAIMLTGGMLHGMDPPRHLWAVSRRGMITWSQRHGLELTHFCCDLADLPFSPFYYRPAGTKGKIKELLGRHVFAPLRGGTHFVAILKKPAQPAA